jgi:hypothetical protein
MENISTNPHEGPTQESGSIPDRGLDEIVPGYVSNPEEIADINDPERLSQIIDQMARILDPENEKNRFDNVPSGLARHDLPDNSAQQDKIKEKYLDNARKILEAAKAKHSAISH